MGIFEKASDVVKKDDPTKPGDENGEGPKDPKPDCEVNGCVTINIYCGEKPKKKKES